jgi:hypothetical protein
MRLDLPVLPVIRRIKNHSLVPVVAYNPSLLPFKSYSVKHAPRQPLPTLPPPRTRDEEEDGEGDIKAKPPAGFPLSGWARWGCGWACSTPSIKRGQGVCFGVHLVLLILWAKLCPYRVSQSPLFFNPFFSLPSIKRGLRGVFSPLSTKHSPLRTPSERG